MRRSHVTMAMIVCAMFGGAMAALYLVEPPPGAREPLLLLTGSLSAAFGAVVAYWFGTTAGSADKTALLARVQPPAPPTSNG